MGLLTIDAAQFERQLQVLARRQEGNEVCALRDDRDRLPAELRAGSEIERRDPLAENDRLTRGRKIDAGEQVKERRFPRSGGAADNREAPGLEPRAESVEDLRGTVALAELPKLRDDTRPRLRPRLFDLARASRRARPRSPPGDPARWRSRR